MLISMDFGKSMYEYAMDSRTRDISCKLCLYVRALRLAAQSLRWT